MTHRAILILLVVAAALAFVPTDGRTQDGEPPEVVAVRAFDRAKIIDAKGHFLALERTPVVIRVRAYRGDWTVVSALEPGTLVRRGEVLVEFEDERLRREVDAARFDLERAMVGLRHQERNAEKTRESVKDEVARAERDLDQAKRNLERWVTHDLPIAREDARLSHESWKTTISNAREELEELERMYGEDELVDATEELVLKRSRRSLEQRLAQYEQFLKKREVQVEYDESRRAEALRFDLEMKERSHRRRGEQIEMQERDRRLGLEAARRDLEDKERRMDDLRHDLELIRLRAPRDGVLLYGTDVTDDQRLKPGDRVGTGQTTATIVDPRVLTVRFTVPATNLLSLAPGLEFEATPNVTGAPPRAGRVEKVSMFAAKETITLQGPIEVGDDAKGAIGGVGCAVRLRTGTERVLVVPAGAVRKTEQGSFCRVRRDDGTVETREVKTGDEIETGLVVTDGLSEGEKVLVGGAWE